MRPIGFVTPARALASGLQALVMSVSKAPGSTRLTRTRGAHAPASPIVIALSAALAIAYGRSPTSGRSDPAVDTLMIEPPAPAFIPLPNTAPRPNGPFALAACVLSCRAPRSKSLPRGGAGARPLSRAPVVGPLPSGGADLGLSVAPGDRFREPLVAACLLECLQGAAQAPAQPRARRKRRPQVLHALGD